MAEPTDIIEPNDDAFSDEVGGELRYFQNSNICLQVFREPTLKIDSARWHLYLQVFSKVCRKMEGHTHHTEEKVVFQHCAERQEANKVVQNTVRQWTSKRWIESIWHMQSTLHCWTRSFSLHLLIQIHKRFWILPVGQVRFMRSIERIVLIMF